MHNRRTERHNKRHGCARLTQRAVSLSTACFGASPPTTTTQEGSEGSEGSEGIGGGKLSK